VAKEIPRELATRLETEGKELDPSIFDYLLWLLVWPDQQGRSEHTAPVGDNLFPVCAPLFHISSHLRDCPVLLNLIYRRLQNKTVDKDWDDVCRESYEYWQGEFLNLRNGHAYLDDRVYEKMIQAKQWALRFYILLQFVEKKMECKMGALAPYLLGLPVPCSVSGAMEAAYRHLLHWRKYINGDVETENLQQVNWDSFAKPLRIVQWEIMTRDLLAESFSSQLL
jgi:hypothetical protein